MAWSAAKWQFSYEALQTRLAFCTAHSLPLNRSQAPQIEPHKEAGYDVTNKVLLASQGIPEVSSLGQDDFIWRS